MNNFFKIFILGIISISITNCNNQYEILEQTQPTSSKYHNLSNKMHKVTDETNWFMEETLNNGNFSALASSSYIGNNQWQHDTINGAYIGVNGWALRSGIFNDGYISWSHSTNNNTLSLEWFVGGYHRDYNGSPEHGYYGDFKGGNDVKAYPRIAIGSSSGQANASFGSPDRVPSAVTDGVRHVDFEKVKSVVGLPSRYKDAPQIDINIDLNFLKGSDAVPSKDKYGNYFLAIDSYFHDVDNPNYTTKPSLAGSLSGINDSSGNIYGVDMNSLPDTTKRWAMMIWYAKSPYFESSGGTTIGRDIIIGGIKHIVKYKVEKASNKAFRYASFIMDRDASAISHSNLKQQLRFNDYADFLTSGAYQQLLDNYMDSNGLLPDVDDNFRRITAPTRNFVLTDISIGVEILSNPDTEEDTSIKPVQVEFKDVYFSVEGKGLFGFKGDSTTSGIGNYAALGSNSTTPLQGPPAAPSPALPEETTNNPSCVDTDGDGWGWNQEQGLSCKIDEEPIEDTQQNTSPNDLNENLTDQCIDTDGDGWGWNQNLGVSCKINSTVNNNQQPSPATPFSDNQNDDCIDSDGDGWGWNQELGVSCKIDSTEVNFQQPQPTDTNASSECIDSDGDGWGWNQELGVSCKR